MANSGAVDSSLVEIFTIGHEALAEPIFLNALKKANVKTLVDVRSVPTSFYKQFKKKNLSKLLSKNGFQYVWSGKELGGKSHSEELKEILSDRDRAIPLLTGVLAQGRKPLCFMCKEHDYRQCHRCDISDALARYNLAKVTHIQVKGFRVEFVPHEVFKPQLVTILEEIDEDTGLKMAGCWTHHLYGSEKKARVNELAESLNLVGFCVTGWPGIMVVEGESSKVDTFTNTVADESWREFRVKHQRSIRECKYEFWNFLDQDPDYTKDYDSKFGAPDLILKCLQAGDYESLFDILMFKKNNANDIVFGHQFNKHI